MHTFSERLRAAATADPNKPITLDEHGITYTAKDIERYSLESQRNVAGGSARRAAIQLLRSICADESIPMAERAAWTTAFHTKRSTPILSEGDFANSAEECHEQLAELDAMLRQPGTPILGFVTGELPGGQNRQNALRYTYRVSSGDGLQYTQQHNGAAMPPHHVITAPEKEYWNDSANLGPHTVGKQTIHEEWTPTVLADWAAPGKAAEALGVRQPAIPTRYLLIGHDALNATFEMSRDTIRGELLLGHAVMRGFRPDF